MPKGLTDKENEYVTRLITEAVEPSIKALIDKFNEFLKKKDIEVGAEIQWVYRKSEKESKDEK